MQLEKRSNIRPYESVIIFHPDASEEDQKSVLTKNKAIIQSFKGEFLHADSWGRRNLANPIGKTRKAIYYHTSFQAAPEAIAELERTMRISDLVLRFMHTRLPDDTNVAQHVENFKKAIVESATREREKEARFQKARAARAARRDEDSEPSFGGGEEE